MPAIVPVPTAAELWGAGQGPTANYFSKERAKAGDQLQKGSHRSWTEISTERPPQVR